MKLGFELNNTSAGIPVNNDIWVQCEGSNPYGKENLKTAKKFENADKVKELLSIPSPYARLHLAETAFDEASAVDFNSLPPVYKKAISHCLDVFEMFYLEGRNELDLIANNIKVEKYVYQDSNDKNSLSDNAKLYLEALDIFRYDYNHADNVAKDFFKNFYVIKKRIVKKEYVDDCLVAMTSPFSVFSTADDMDEECVIRLENLEEDDKGDNIVLFSPVQAVEGKDLWTGIESRSKNFKRFMCSVANYLHTNRPTTLLSSFVEYFKQRAKDIYQSIDGQVFTEGNDFAIYNKNGVIGQQIAIDKPLMVNNASQKVIELLPSGYDTYLFLSFLEPENAIDIAKLKEANDPAFLEQQSTDITKRRDIFNGGMQKQILPWITVDDLLEDTLYLPKNKINTKKYFSCENAIVPFKPLFFELFSIFKENELVPNEGECGDIKTWATVEEKEDGNFDVILSLPGVNGKNVKLVKRYFADQVIKDFDLDFGIFPFSQVRIPTQHEGPDNFYRLMLYVDEDVDLDNNGIVLYAQNNEGLLIPDAISKNTKPGEFHVQSQGTLTRKRFPSLTSHPNLYYMSLESFYQVPTSNGYERQGEYNSVYSSYKDVSFNFVQVNLRSGSFILVPRFKVIKDNNGSSRVAIDLGTSNTYVSVAHSDDNTFTEFGSIRENNDYLVGKLCLEDSDIVSQNAEFLPPVFYKKSSSIFPIPTVLYQSDYVVSDDLLNKNTTGRPFVSMFTLNIPFSIEYGQRRLDSKLIDRRLTDFKWFSVDSTKAKERNAFQLFVDQICLLIRGELLANGEKISGFSMAWTYPLALEERQIGYFRSAWNTAYQKYFGNNPNSNSNNIPEKGFCGKLIAYSESETPIEAEAGIAQEQDYKLGIDIGGGSSDIILFYRVNQHEPNEVKLATSFKYAGGSLFGKNVINKDNLWYNTFKDIAEYVKEVELQKQKDNNTQSVVEINKSDYTDNDFNVSDMMGYIFTKGMAVSRQDIMKKLSSPEIKFVSTFHTTALIWEIAKYCKLQLEIDNKTNSQMYIALSGNGSKLIMLPYDGDVNQEQFIQRLFVNIFKEIKVPVPSNKIFLHKLQEPKKATCWGALSLLKDKQTSRTQGKQYVEFLGRLCVVGETNPSRLENPKNATPMMEDDPFGGWGSDNSSKPKQTPSSVVIPTSQTLGSDYKPLVDNIMKNKGVIKADLIKFLDLYFNQLAATPLTGQLQQDQLARIRQDLFGSTSSFDTPELDSFIERAKNSLSGTSEITTSIFLAVIEQIIARLNKIQLWK